LLDRIKQLDSIIERGRARRDCGTTYSMIYGSTDNIQLRIDLMQRAGATQTEVEKYKKEHWIFKSVRRMAWEEAKESGDLERAIEILQESRKIDQDDRYDVAAYTRQLINLYHETGKTEEEKEERYRVFIDGAGADIKQFRTLKGMCGTGEWNQKRSHIIFGDKRCGIALCVSGRRGNV